MLDRSLDCCRVCSVADRHGADEISEDVAPGWEHDVAIARNSGDRKLHENRQPARHQRLFVVREGLTKPFDDCTFDDLIAAADYAAQLAAR